MPSLLDEIRDCQVCAGALPLGPRPIVQLDPAARILIVGQAPGQRVHASGVPWDDPSGQTLRSWMGITPECFYDSRQVALLPMGFCYPGKGRSGDLPPRPECAPLWHTRARALLGHVRLTLLIGQYAQAYYLAEAAQATLTDTVAHYAHYLPHTLPLPHPSPRNRPWLSRNPWFSQRLIPDLQQLVQQALA